MSESLNKEEADTKTLTKKKYNKSNLINNKFSFHGYIDDNKFDSLSFKSKYSYLLTFYDLKKLSHVKPRYLRRRKTKKCMMQPLNYTQ